MLAGIYYGAQYGGSTTAILVNLPGEATSVVTVLDGHQMAKQGRAGVALGVAALASFFAGTVATVVIAALGAPLTKLALIFGPHEYFSLMVMGLVFAVVLARGSILKAIAMILAGVLLSTVGTDLETGESRMTFGLDFLADGIDFAVLAMGVFGIAEILRNLDNPETREVVRAKIGRLLPNREDLRQSAMPVLRGTLVGGALGILPGNGAVLGPFASYTLEKKLAKDPRRFGRGAIEGVAGPEAANNAAVASGMIPLLSLGLPGNAVTALLMGALVISGVQPGPMLIVERPDVFWGVVASMYVGNLFLLVLNLPMVGLWVQLLRVPYSVLFPVIVLLAMVGTYSANRNPFDLWVMLGFGVFGWFLRKLDYELAPMVLAFVLAPLLEQSLRQSMVMSPDGALIFLQRPVSAALLGCAAAIILLMAVGRRGRRRPLPTLGEAP
jgi:putative tricarboxylic transport membrane protein